MELETAKKTAVRSILISQPEPEGKKSPYYEIAKKYGIKVDFRQFIQVDGVAARDFRKQKVNILDHTAIIFTSRNSIDHYFRICEETRVQMPQGTKYFCTSESIALYLQKYIQYRKRKVFYGSGRLQSLLELLAKHPSENFLYPCSDVRKDDLPNFLSEKGIEFTEAVLYKTVAADLSDLSDIKYDMLVFFSPSGIKSLYINFPDFEQGATRLAIFGPTTLKAVEEAGLDANIKAPSPECPSMTMAIQKYLDKVNK
jgi:uroporphyrinogen-III synthase